MHSVSINTLMGESRFDTFRRKFRQARLAAEITQLEVAKRVGMSRFAIINFETKGTIPRYDKCMKLAKLFDLQTPKL